ncbi:MAG TPA: 5-formyltetrahydrofolate cyclo-ligase [Candidatus Binataceae bacterium]|jgi:5-formyltetrahydrofolate cyclo-ligase|nr:5-formyltetrahydrofolate cyclo-ligase [Candidatus Binataceae bacterium]
MADQKHRLRKVIRECREALSREQAWALSRYVQTTALELECYRCAAAVLLYAAVGNEVATNLIFDDARSAGRPVYFPVADPAAHSLDFRAVRSSDDLRSGHFGIPEPSDGERFEPQRGDAAVVFVPGLAFSSSGERLGGGGGFYDRFLALTGPGVTAVGLAYSFQVLERLPQEPWDRRLHYVVTERAVHDARNPGQWRA